MFGPAGNWNGEPPPPPLDENARGCGRSGLEEAEDDTGTGTCTFDGTGVVGTETFTTGDGVALGAIGVVQTGALVGSGYPTVLAAGCASDSGGVGASGRTSGLPRSHVSIFPVATQMTQGPSPSASLPKHFNACNKQFEHKQMN